MPTDVSNTAAATSALAEMQERLNRLRAAQLRPSELTAWATGQTDLLAQLPPQFGVVLNDLLNRLEAGAMFSEESCSFSQRDIWDSLQMWLDKAQARIVKH